MVPQMEDGIQKACVIKPGYFEFGPLICGKTRDRWETDDGSESLSAFVLDFVIVLTDSHVSVFV